MNPRPTIADVLSLKGFLRRTFSAIEGVRHLVETLKSFACDVNVIKRQCAVSGDWPSIASRIEQARLDVLPRVRYNMVFDSGQICTKTLLQMDMA